MDPLRLAHAILWAREAQLVLTGEHFVAVGEVIAASNRLLAAREELHMAHRRLADTDATHLTIGFCECSTAKAFRTVS